MLMAILILKSLISEILENAMWVLRGLSIFSFYERSVNGKQK